MSKHKEKIKKIFEHPMSGNIEAKKLLSALEHFGAEVDLTKENHAKIHLNGKMFSMPLPHKDHTLAKDTIVELRHFLEEVGLTPDSI
ncbi:hypothetical protein MNB_SM-5-755 [hydrothermal vent metagenome]|uniref:HicA protein n=1 Tax=hydrothermal vent metagenome TaxID=652676 RepID=A0A1W1CIF9_9ZZZZ